MLTLLRFLGRRQAIAGLLALVTIGPLSAQRPLNLDFEMRSAAYQARPWGWTLGWSAFAAGPAAEYALDTVRVTGAFSLRITAQDTGSTAPVRGLMLQLPGQEALGKTLLLTGHLRAAGAHASVTLEAWGDRVIRAADTVIRMGDADQWTPFSLRIMVPEHPDIHAVVVTVGAQGTGSAWFDAFALSIDGASVTDLPPEANSPTPAELAWLSGRSTPLHTVVSSEPPDDRSLAAVDRIVGDAQIVGLGESTHGTREFFQVKHRVLEYLVRQHGFTMFAIEANQLAVEHLNAWVMGGTGTARDAMRVLFRVWNTEEMLALVEWARAYNAAQPSRPLRFVGYDMQDHRRPLDSLRAFLTRTDASRVAPFDGWTAAYRAEASYATPHIPEATRARWHHQADSLWRAVAGRRAAWLAAARSGTDSLATEWAVQNAELVRQAARFNVALNSPERDSLMAANLDWALRTLAPGARVVVWAHDVHVSHGGDTERSFNAGAQMGAHLRQSYGYAYRAFSLLTASGAYSATRSFSDHEIIAAEAFPAPIGSMESALAAVARPAGSIGLIVDLRSSCDDPAAGWLWRPRPIRHVGYATYDYGFEMTAVMPLEFDGVIFIERSEPSRMLR
jgi:erythromycin esterase